MAQYNDYNPAIRCVIDDAIKNGVEVANEMMNDLTHEELVKLSLISFVHQQCCVSLALSLSAHENGDPEYAPSSMRQAMHERLCNKVRVTC